MRHAPQAYIVSGHLSLILVLYLKILNAEFPDLLHIVVVLALGFKFNSFFADSSNSRILFSLILPVIILAKLVRVELLFNRPVIFLNDQILLAFVDAHLFHGIGKSLIKWQETVHLIVFQVLSLLRIPLRLSWLLMCIIAELRRTTSLRELGPLLVYRLRCLSPRRHSILLGWLHLILLLMLSLHLRIIYNLLSVWRPSSHWRRHNSSRWSRVEANWLVRDHFWTRRVWIRLPWRTHRHVHITTVLLLMAYHWSWRHTSLILLLVHLLLLIRLMLELLLRKIWVHQLLVRSILFRRVTLILDLLSIFSVWRL